MRFSTPLLDALSMGLLNLGAALVLLAMHLINALYDWANVFVTFAAPLGAAFFLVLSIVWAIEWMRRMRAHRSVPAQAPSSGTGGPWRSRPRSLYLVPVRARPHPMRRLVRAALGRNGAGQVGRL